MNKTGMLGYLTRSLQVKMLLSSQCVVVAGGIIALMLGIRLYGKSIFEQAQDRVANDLSAARMVYLQEVNTIETVVQMTAERFFIKEGLAQSRFERVEQELQRVKTQNSFDLLTLTDPRGIVLLRIHNPPGRGDDLSEKDMIREALKGEPIAGTAILSAEDLAREGDSLVERACIDLVPTEQSKPRRLRCETSGMVLQAASPVTDESGRVLGVLCGGKVLNRNGTIVDRIRDTLFGEKTYRGRDVGTATIFLWDLRIATNVRTVDGERAIGTSVSSDVYERVLEQGGRYTGRAFVVHSSYITAYEPIRDTAGKIVGMLYVGILEQPFLDIRNEVIYAFLGVAVVGMIITFMLSVVLTKSITRPVNKLVKATRELSAGSFPSEVRVYSNDEIGHLADTFNSMSRDLCRTMEEKDAVNKNLLELNQRYLELLGFTTHELKQPLEVLNGYLIMLQNESIGTLTTSQQREAIGDMRINVTLMTDMIQKYLQLSKIESGELSVHRRRTKVYPEIVQPLLTGEEQRLASRKMALSFENREVLEHLELDVDPLLMRIVFSNLIDNAIKYGRKEGTITVGYSPHNGFHRFHVANEGSGIPPQFLNRVFEKFARIGKAGNVKVMGTGLGLYNTRVIVEKHGGKIWVESEEGRWADFIFLIPDGHL